MEREKLLKKKDHRERKARPKKVKHAYNLSPLKKQRQINRKNNNNSRKYT